MREQIEENYYAQEEEEEKEIATKFTNTERHLNGKICKTNSKSEPNANKRERGIVGRESACEYWRCMVLSVHCPLSDENFARAIFMMIFFSFLIFAYIKLRIDNKYDFICFQSQIGMDLKHNGNVLQEGWWWWWWMVFVFFCVLVLVYACLIYIL